MDALDDAAARLSSWKTWTLVPAVCAIAALCLLAIDLPVARFFREGGCPKFLSDVLNNAEPFGHAAGVVLIVVTVLALDVRARWLAPALAGAALSGGIAANIGKLLVSRARPRSFDLAHGTLWDTFGEWLPLFSHGAREQSFPSAHTATAVGLAVMLCAAYPRGRWWFITLAVLVGLHRIQVSAHYPSDVLVGAALGWMMGHLSLLAAVKWRLRHERDDERPDTLPLRRAV
jgi:membrane-associated phospholipid phosphatase